MKRIKALACAAFILWVLVFTVTSPVFGQAQVKKGSVVARGLVYGPEGFQIWTEYGSDGRPIRVIGEASPVNGLDDANVISGKDYLTYIKVYNDFMEQHREGIAKGAYLVSREDYDRLSFKTVPTKQQPIPIKIENPKLFPFTKSVLVRADDQLLHAGINPVLLQSGINLKNIGQGVNEGTLSVLLDKQSNVREVSTGIIAYRMAYYFNSEADLSDTTLDDVMYYAESMGAKPVAPLRGVFVGTSLGGGDITNQEGKYFMFYVIPSCPGFFYYVDTLVWAELHYRNFNPKAPKINTYYATAKSVDMCDGTQNFMPVGMFILFYPTSSFYSFKHIIPVDLIMFRGEGNLFNKWTGPTLATKEIGPRIKVQDQTVYDEGEDEEINKDWPKADEPEKRLIKNALWDLDLDGLSDLAVADKEKGIVKFWKRGKDPLHHSPSLSREMRIKKLTQPLDPKELAPADFKNTDLFVYKGNKLVAKHVGLDSKFYDKDRNIYLIYPEAEAEVKEGDNLDAVLTYRDQEAGYLGRTNGKMTKLGIEVELDDVSLNAPAYEIESPKDQTHRGLLKSIKPADLQDTDVYLFSENTGKLLCERIGLQYVAEEGENDKMLTFWLKTLGPRQELFNPGSYISKTQAQIELFKKEVAHLRVGSRVKAIVINRKTGYIGTTTAEIKKTLGESLGSSSMDFSLGKIELYPPNLKIWAERTYKVKQGLTKDQERENVISFGGSGLTDDTLVLVKSAWLDHDGSLLPEELPGLTGRLAKVTGNNQVGPAGSGDAALFAIKPGFNTQLIQLPQKTLDNEHFYVQVCAVPKEGRGTRNPSFASGNASGKLEFRPDYYVPFLVPFFNADLTLLNAEAQAGKLSQEWKEGEEEPVLKDIEKVYDWFFRPELQFSLFELDLADNLKVDITTEIGSGTTAIVDYFIKSPQFDPLAPFGPQRQLLFSLGYAEILALLNKKEQAKFPSLDDLLAMQPAARAAMLREALDQLEPEDFLGLQLYQADDEGNGLYEYYGLPLAVSDSRPFELKNIYNSSQFDQDVPATIGGEEIPGFKALEFYLMQPATVKALILDSNKIERQTLIAEQELPPGRYNFFADFKTVQKALNYDAEDPEKSPYFYIQVQLKDQEGIVTQKILYPGRLNIAPEGEMLGQIMVHDVLIQDGSLNLSRQDLAFKSRGPELGFSRSYSNLTPVENDSILGTGWNHNYDKKLCARCSEQDAGEECIPAWAKEKFGTFFRPSQIPDADKDKWTMVVVNGTTFKKVGETWRPERGRHGSLEEKEEQGLRTFTFTSKDGTKYEYDYPEREKPKTQAAYIHIGDSLITRIGLDPKLLELMKPDGTAPNPADPPKPAPIKKITDRHNNSLNLVYKEIEDPAPPEGREPQKEKLLIQAIDSTGRGLTFDYIFMAAGRQGRQARLQKVTGPDNIVLNYTYDDKGYLLSAQRAERKEDYAYAKEPTQDKDAYNLVKTTDTNQHSHSYEYYLPGEVSYNPDVFVRYMRSQDVIKSVTYPGPGSPFAGFGYSMSTYNQRTIRDLRGNTTTYILNKYGNPTEIREPLSRTTRMAWSIDEGTKDNVMTSRTDGRGNTTRYQYDDDDKGNIVGESTAGISGSIVTTWDPKFSQPLSRRDRNNVTEAWQYDSQNGNLLTYTNGESKSYTYTYYETGERRTSQDPKGNTTSYTYDAYGNPDTISEPEGSETDLDFDIRGRLLAKTDSLNHRTQYTYDDLDYPRTILYPDIDLPAGSSRSESFSYDTEGNKKSETNRLGLTLTYNYTPRDQVSNIIRSIGGTKNFSYDENGNLLSESDWKEAAASHTYDELNQRTSTTNRMHDTLFMAYDDAGNLEEVTDYNNNKTTYQYDALNRVTDIDQPAPGGNIHRTYFNEADPKRNLKSETDQEGNKTEYTYTGLYQVHTRTNALTHTYTWDYDENGNLLKETDEEDKITEYRYDGQNRLRFVDKYLEGRPVTTEFQYDLNGNRRFVIDPKTHKIETKYDKWNRAYEVIDAVGNKTTTVLDALGNPVEIRDGNANDQDYVTHVYNRDQRGLVMQETDAEDNTVSYTYDLNGNQESATNSLGLEIRTAYDAEDRPMLVTETGQIGGTRNKAILERDAMGNPRQIRDYNGNVSRIEYNALNLAWRAYDAANQYTETAYYRTGKVKEVTDRRKNKTGYEYDALNRLHKTSFPHPADSQPITIVVDYDKTGHARFVTDKRHIVTENIYDDFYRLTETRKAGTRIVTNEYDDAGNLTAVIDAKNNRTEHAYYENNLLHITTLPAVNGQTHTTVRSYDKVGNLKEMTDPEGKVSSYVYDKNNRQTSVTFAGETTSKEYDATGNVTLITKPAQNKRMMEYDSFNRLIRVIDDPDRLRLITRYVYDANNNLIHQYDVKNHEVEFVYNELNQKTKHIQHTGAGEITTSFEDYDEEGNLLALIDPNLNRIVYTYDELNRQVETQYPNLNRSFNNIIKVVTEYDANNNVTTVTEIKQGPNGTVTDVTVNHYDNFDRMDDTVQRGVAIDYGYDLNGNRTKVKTANGETVYVYDARNRLSTADADGAVTVYSYYPDGKKDTITYPNNTGSKYTYYNNNRIQSIVHTSGAATLSSYTYVYDANGNRLRQDEIQNGALETTRYQYDTADRMTRFAIDGPNTVETTYTFEGYDRATERVVENGEVKSDKVYNYDEINRLVKIVDNPMPQPLKTIDYLYDLNGNTLSKKDSSLPDGDQTFTYDSRNQLIEVKRGPPGSEESLGKYDYNAEGLRVRYRNSERGDVDYYYDDNAVLEEHKANDNSLLAHYRYADRLLSLETTIEVQYYYQDGLGSTTNLTDQLGTLKVSYRLDTWGHIRQQVGDSVNRQIFTGQEHDLKTGLIYFGARFYDPDTARFITQDSYLGESNTPPSLHRYLYAYSNPTVYVDLEGYAAEDETIYTQRYRENQSIEIRKAKIREEAMHDERKYKYQYAWMTVEDSTGAAGHYFKDVLGQLRPVSYYQQRYHLSNEVIQAIDEIAKHMGIPREALYPVYEQESSFRPRVRNTDVATAIRKEFALRLAKFYQNAVDNPEVKNMQHIYAEELTKEKEEIMLKTAIGVTQFMPQVIAKLIWESAYPKKKYPYTKFKSTDPAARNWVLSVSELVENMPLKEQLYWSEKYMNQSYFKSKKIERLEDLYLLVFWGQMEPVGKPTNYVLFTSKNIPAWKGNQVMDRNWNNEVDIEEMSFNFIRRCFGQNPLGRPPEPKGMLRIFTMNQITNMEQRRLRSEYGIE